MTDKSLEAARDVVAADIDLTLDEYAEHQQVMYSPKDIAAKAIRAWCEAELKTGVGGFEKAVNHMERSINKLKESTQ